MTRKHTLAALLTAAALLTNASAAHAWGWNMLWFNFGASPGGIVLNGTSFTGANRKSDRLRAKTGHRIISATAPVILNPVPTPVKIPPKQWPPLE